MVQAAQAALPAVAGGGRATHRGGAGEEPRPGRGDVAAATSGIAAMRVGGADRGAMRGGRRRMEASYEEPHTRPEHITDKTGKSLLLIATKLLVYL